MLILANGARLRLLIVLWALIGLSACNLTNAPPTVIPALPSVRFIAPENNVIVPQGTDLQIRLLASDEGGLGIAGIDFIADGEIVQSVVPEASAAVPVMTIDVNWLAAGAGRHVLEAIAFRPDGTPSDAAAISVQVSE